VDTETTIKVKNGESGILVFDPSIQSWILKHSCKMGDDIKWVGFRPFDPVVDTETQFCCISLFPGVVVFDPSIQSWILKLRFVTPLMHEVNVFDPSIQSWILNRWVVGVRERSS